MDKQRRNEGPQPLNHEIMYVEDLPDAAEAMKDFVVVPFSNLFPTYQSMQRMPN